MRDTEGRGGSGRRAGIVVTTGMLLVAVLLVFLSLRRPDPPTYAPSPVEPRPAGERQTGVEERTVDARDGGRWRYFSFSLGTVVEDPRPFDWDIAFRRFQVMVNGGPGFPGMGGAIDLGEVDFDQVLAVPREGYLVTPAGSDSTHPALHRWYRYSFLSHLLSPKPHVFALRTADGRYAKVEFLGYYCPGAVPGCVTFRYVYQGGGGASLDAGG